MARLLAIDTCTVGLRNALLQNLRSTDEAILLPQANQSIESSEFKNICFRLDGNDTGLNPSVFAHDWFSGLSIVRIPEGDAHKIEKIIETPSEKKRMLELLTTSIKSESVDSSIQIGPSLDCDEFERDKEGENWDFGFDSSNSFVGVFSAQNPRPPENGTVGMLRAHKEFYIVCRAGGGVSASTFHARVLSALSKNVPLEAMFNSEGLHGPGPVALRRVATAGTRNRSRIIHKVSEILGLMGVSAVGDQAGRNLFRGAVPDVDVVINCLRKLDDVASNTWQYNASCVDGRSSKGLATLSNATDGLTLFLSQNNETKFTVKNETWASIPFSTERVVTTRDLSNKVLECYRSGEEHPDATWISNRFSWKNREFTSGQPNVEPFAFWGDHLPESFTKSFGRELGLSEFKAVHLHPELVCVAGVEPGKLRAIVSSLR
jgi:hypothetical protein